MKQRAVANLSVNRIRGISPGPSTSQCLRVQTTPRRLALPSRNPMMVICPSSQLRLFEHSEAHRRPLRTSIFPPSNACTAVVESCVGSRLSIDLESPEAGQSGIRPWLRRWRF